MDEGSFRPPDGWYVLWCRDETCLMSLAWTAQDSETYGTPDAWFAALHWSSEQVEHGPHSGRAA